VDRKTLELSILSALRKNNFAQAVDMAYAHGRRDTAPGAMEYTAWANDANKLVLIFSSTPLLLESVPAGVMEQIRLVAGLQYLMGDDDPLQVLRYGSQVLPGTHIRSPHVSGQLLRHVDFLLDMEKYRENAETRANLRLAFRQRGDGQTCPSCKRTAERRYGVHEVFELPNPLCTCELGCRCVLQPLIL
jgi:hypothetical protein